MGYYYHDVPGRLRVKIPFMKRNPERSEAIRAELLHLYGVTTVEVSTVTGSVVIRYEPELVKMEEILCCLEQTGYFDVSKAVTNDQHVYAAAAQTGGILWKALAGVLVERALEGSALSLLAVLI